MCTKKRRTEKKMCNVVSGYKLLRAAFHFKKKRYAYARTMLSSLASSAFTEMLTLPSRASQPRAA